MNEEPKEHLELLFEEIRDKLEKVEDVDSSDILSSEEIVRESVPQEPWIVANPIERDSTTVEYDNGPPTVREPIGYQHNLDCY